MDTAPRLVFAGTPEFAADILRRLLNVKITPLAVYTQPDRRAGRGNRVQPSATKAVAMANKITIEQPTTLRDSVVESKLDAYRPELIVVAAYGLILPKGILSIPPLGCINVHASLLPRWRGAAPVERAIEAGDRETGITIMQMDEGLDTGDMLLTKRTSIGESETGSSLRKRLSALGAEALIEVLYQMCRGTVSRKPQPTQGISYAHKLTRDEAALEWNRPAAVLCRKIRAFVNANVCHSELDGQRVRVWAAKAVRSGSSRPGGEILSADRSGIVVSCGDQALRIESLQLPGGKVLTAEQCLNARRSLFVPGKRFSTVSPA